MIAPRGSQLYLLIDPAWTPQADIDTKNSAASLTRVIQMTTKADIEIDESEDPIMDCTGQSLTNVTVLSRKLTLPLEFDCDAELLAGFAGACMGDRDGNNLEMLDTGEFQPPFLTGCIMFKNFPLDTGRLFTFMVNSFKVDMAGRTRVKVSVELVGPGNVEDAGLEALPPCTELIPVYSYECALTIDDVDRMQKNGDLGTATEAFGLAFSNKALVQDDAFQLASIDMTRAERADVRDCMMTWKPEDYSGGALSIAAHTNPRTKYAVIWRVGTAIKNTTFTAAEAILRAEKKEQGFEGEAGRAVLNLTLQPTPVGDAMQLSGVLTLP
jgi:hypothetical protein